MIIDPITFAEREYTLPFIEIVSGYAADGESIIRTASILHVELSALRHYAAAHRIEFKECNCPIPEPGINRKASRRAASQKFACSGMSLSPIEWQLRTGISADTIRKRIARGWDPARAITTATMSKEEVASCGVNARRRK